MRLIKKIQRGVNMNKKNSLILLSVLVLFVFGVYIANGIQGISISGSSTSFTPGDSYSISNYTKGGLNATINFTLVIDTIVEGNGTNNITSITFELPSNVIMDDFNNVSNGSSIPYLSDGTSTGGTAWPCVSTANNGLTNLNWTCQNDSALSNLSNGAYINIWFNFTANLTGTEEPIVWKIITLDDGNNQSVIELSTNVDDRAPGVSEIERVTTSKTITYNDNTGVEYKCSGSDANSIKEYTWTLIKPNCDEVKTIHTSGDGSDTITFKESDLNRLGTHNVRCKIKDIFDHYSGEKTTSSTADFVVHAEVTGTGSSGVSDGGAAAISFDTDFTTANEGSIKAQQGRIKSFSFDGVTKHTITFNTVTSSSATLTIASTPVTLNIGETKDVDVNADGTNDMSVKLNAILNGVADVTIEEIEEGSSKIVGEEESARGIEQGVTPKVTTPIEKAGLAWLWWLIGIIVIVALGYYFFFKKK